MRLLPVMAGVPSPLQYTSGASLPPGEYTLKLAVVEGDRVGTVEHMIHAELPTAGDAHAQRADGGRAGRDRAAADADDRLPNQLRRRARLCRGLRRRQRRRDDGVRGGDAPDAPALLNADVPAHQVSDSRIIFTKVLQTHQLPPGKYVLRAILSAEGKSIKTLTRGFEVAAPKVLLTSADGLGGDTVGRRRAVPAGRRTRDDAAVPARHRRRRDDDRAVPRARHRQRQGGLQPGD